jgi:hypothetical protein
MTGSAAKEHKENGIKQWNNSWEKGAGASAIMVHPAAEKGRFYAG